MIGKNFITSNTRCLLNEFIAPIAEQTDKPRQNFYPRLSEQYSYQVH